MSFHNATANKIRRRWRRRCRRLGGDDDVVVVVIVFIVVVVVDVISSSEGRMIVAWVVLTQYQRVTDTRPDGRTELLLLQRYV